jgi:SAM-dependent methyltransferase
VCRNEQSTEPTEIRKLAFFRTKQIRMTLENLREVVSRLGKATSTLAAVGTALHARTSGRELESALALHVDEVLEALGVRDAVATTPAAQLLPLLAEARTYALTSAKLLSTPAATTAARDPAQEPRASAGWNHTESELLQAAGDVSMAFAEVLRTRLLCHLDGLPERLEAPSATFLDVGVGVASLSIEMARSWPELHVLGIDPLGPALALARQNVQRAGLDLRIELREQSVDVLSETDRFDLAWIPSLFLPERAIPAACERVRRALRPGGWLLFAAMKRSQDPLAAALAGFRTALFGGFITTPERVALLLREAGFVDVKELPSSPTALAAIFAARRAI